MCKQNLEKFRTVQVVTAGEEEVDEEGAES
jgi:hypothetical protein